MAVGVVMPKAGITVEECIITEWKKKVGDSVSVGDILFSYETDKAAFECESTAEGEILAVFYGDGDEVPVLVNVCAVGTKGDDFSALDPKNGASPVEEKAEEAVKEEKKVEAVATADASADYKISPRAKALAAKLGIDAANVAPSGPYGRIIERDVKAFGEANKGSGIGGKVLAADKANAPATAEISEEIEFADVKFSKIRSVIAASMKASLSGMAQLTHNHSFDATEIMSLRKSLKAASSVISMPNITLNDMVLYAVSRVLMNHPDLNANMLGEDTVRHFKDVHLGVAVDTPRGLMVPTLFFANRKSLAQISVEAKDLIKQAQAGTINPDLLRGGTFTVTNLGSLGVESFTPVINPPQTAILGVCNMTTRLKPDGKPYQAMGLSLTYDHRVVDGAPAARFAQELCKELESFTALLEREEK